MEEGHRIHQYEQYWKTAILEGFLLGGKDRTYEMYNNEIAKSQIHMDSKDQVQFMNTRSMRDQQRHDLPIYHGIDLATMFMG